MISTFLHTAGNDSKVIHKSGKTFSSCQLEIAQAASGNDSFAKEIKRDISPFGYARCNIV